MEPLFEIETVYTHDLYREFMYKTQKLGRQIAIAVAVYAIFCVALDFYYYSTVGVWYLSYLAFIPVMFAVLLFVIAHKVEDAWMDDPFVAQGSVETTYIYEHHIEQVADARAVSVRYEQIREIRSGQRGLYLMLSKKRGLVVDKSRVSPEIKNFLEEKITSR